HATDDVADLHVVGEDRGGPGRARRQPRGKGVIVELDAGHERRGRELPGRDRLARDLGLASRNGLQDALDPSAVNVAGHELESDLDLLTGPDVARIDLVDLDADQRVRRIDKG